jgi:Na+/proline symporter
MSNLVGLPTTRVTPWLKIHILGMAAGLSFMGSTLTTFAVVLRDKGVSGPVVFFGGVLALVALISIGPKVWRAGKALDLDANTEQDPKKI